MNKFESPCDFCGETVESVRNDYFPPFWGLEHLNGGSDHLATWCNVCGPQHRKAN